MRNITLSAREEAIEKARIAAVKKHRTLNDLFREWLEVIGNEQEGTTADQLKDLWQKNNYLKVGKRLTHNEMNER